MIWAERKRDIMEILNVDKSASVKNLSKRLYVSEATVRRDLDKLESEGLVKRSHGGAALVEGLKAEIPLYVRENEQQRSKDLIGQTAASIVSDGDVLIMDSSSTTYSMARYLAGKNDLTILTNGAKTAITLGQILHTTIYCTGGKLRENSLSYVGESAKAFLSSFHTDYLFFSCRAVSFTGDLFDSSIEEAELRRVMFQHAAKRVLLCDSTKLGTYSFCKLGGLRDIDILVTDASLNEADVLRLNEMGVKYILAS